MTTRKASCSCGQLKILCEGEPVRISMCHCLECQKRTGNVFGTQARFPREHVTIEGRSTRWTRLGDSGQPITFNFCPVCGSTVYWELTGAPGFVAVAVGAFADPTSRHRGTRSTTTADTPGCFLQASCRWSI